MGNIDSSIFDNIARRDYLPFKQPGKEYDYAGFAKFMDFEKSDISKIAGVSKSSVRFDQKIPKEVKDRLDEIANICNLVAEFFKGDLHKTGLWFRTKNPMLGNIAPRDMLRLGRYMKLMQFVLDALEDAEKNQPKR